MTNNTLGVAAVFGVLLMVFAVGMAVARHNLRNDLTELDELRKRVVGLVDRKWELITACEDKELQLRALRADYDSLKREHAGPPRLTDEWPSVVKAGPRDPEERKRLVLGDAPPARACPDGPAELHVLDPFVDAGSPEKVAAAIHEAARQQAIRRFIEKQESRP